MRSTNFLAICVLACLITGCTKTDDFLRSQMAMQGDLYDPQSAIFKNVTVDKMSNLWCGQINAKNRLGGYVGWRPFDMKVLSDGRVSLQIFDATALVPRATSGSQPTSEDLEYQAKYELGRLHDSRCKGLRPAPKWLASWP